MKLNSFGGRVEVFKVIFLLLILTISGCSKNDSFHSGNDWKNEVLMMDDCGSDGLKCCIDQDPACLFGQTCCVDFGDPTRNYCASECSYGNLDEYCLEDGTCNDSLVCMNGDCVECGIKDNYCCVSAQKCLMSNSENSDRTECVKNICRSCGHSGKNTCSGEIDCVSGHFNNNGVCLNCGSFNQPCCRGEGDDICLGDDLICELGFCIK